MGPVFAPKSPTHGFSWRARSLRTSFSRSKGGEGDAPPSAHSVRKTRLGGALLKTYRTGAGTAAVGVGADALTMTGYFAQAVNPTSNAISVSTNVVAFSIEVSSFFNDGLWSGAGEHVQCQSHKRLTHLDSQLFRGVSRDSLSRIPGGSCQPAKCHTFMGSRLALKRRQLLWATTAQEIRTVRDCLDKPLRELQHLQVLGIGLIGFGKHGSRYARHVVKRHGR
jgi:hypothetical protein